MVETATVAQRSETAALSWDVLGERKLCLRERSSFSIKKTIYGRYRYCTKR